MQEADSTVLPRLWLVDRDGVLNELVKNGYVLDLAQWRTLDGVGDALRTIRETGAKIAVITNQACIAKGLVAEGTVAEMHALFDQELRKLGAGIDRFYTCPHREEDRCSCRKPQPGLLRQALQDFGIDPKDALMVGDSDRDMLAAQHVGVRAVQAFGHGGLLRVVEAECKCERWK